MVVNGETDVTIITAQYVNDFRKTAVRHSHDLTLNDLTLMLQRIFAIPSSSPIQLKYKDSQGYLISLVDDSDLLLALQTETSLFVKINVESEALNHLEEVRAHLTALLTTIDKLSIGLSSLEHNNTHSSVKRETSSARSPSPATIHPSLERQVLSDELKSHTEEDVHLGGDAASEYSHHSEQPTQQSIPSFPHAQAPLPPASAPPFAPPTHEHQPPVHQPQRQPQDVHPPTSYAPPPSQPSYTPQTAAPPQPFPGQQQGYQQTPPPQQPPQQTQQYAPPQSYPQSAFPSSVPTSSYGSSAPSGYPSQAPAFPSAAPTFSPSQYQPQYGQQPPQPLPPSSFAPPPTLPGAGAPGVNPFARPPTNDYRQSPYHQ